MQLIHNLPVRRKFDPVVTLFDYFSFIDSLSVHAVVVAHLINEAQAQFLLREFM